MTDLCQSACAVLTAGVCVQLHISWEAFSLLSVARFHTVQTPITAHADKETRSVKVISIHEIRKRRNVSQSSAWKTKLLSPNTISSHHDQIQWELFTQFEKSSNNPRTCPDQYSIITLEGLCVIFIEEVCGLMHVTRNLFAQ